MEKKYTAGMCFISATHFYQVKSSPLEVKIAWLRILKKLIENDLLK